jgi:hypothetical protein
MMQWIHLYIKFGLLDTNTGLLFSDSRTCSQISKVYIAPKLFALLVNIFQSDKQDIWKPVIFKSADPKHFVDFGRRNLADYSIFQIREVTLAILNKGIQRGKQSKILEFLVKFWTVSCRMCNRDYPENKCWPQYLRKNLGKSRCISHYLSHLRLSCRQRIR